MKKFVFATLMITVLLTAHAQNTFTEKSRKETFVVRQMIPLSRPWSMAFLPDSDMLVTQKSGELLLIKGDTIVRVNGLPDIAVVGQGGLLDVGISPQFAKDSMVYFTFTSSQSNRYGTSVARGELTDIQSNSPSLRNVQIIYNALPRTQSNIHFGSRLAFDGSGHFFVTLGERGSMNRAQDTMDPYGSVLRLNMDGSIPKDNPFSANNIQSGKAEIWSYGHRNAQGLTINPKTGVLWLTEHGPKGGDEVNIIKKGSNYGWPKVTYGINYNGTIISKLQTAPGIEAPVIHWTPSIAPSGLTFYYGSKFPKWNGNLFAGALAGKHLRRMEITDNKITAQEVLLNNRIGRIRDVRLGPDGFIYLLSDGKQANLYRIEPL